MSISKSIWNVLLKYIKGDEGKHPTNRQRPIRTLAEVRAQTQERTQRYRLRKRQAAEEASQDQELNRRSVDSSLVAAHDEGKLFENTVPTQESIIGSSSSAKLKPEPAMVEEATKELERLAVGMVVSLNAETSKLTKVNLLQITAPNLTLAPYAPR